MIRAEVWRDRSTAGRPDWCVGICHWRDRDAPSPIHERPDYMNQIRTFLTHAEALAWAIKQTKGPTR